MLSGSCSIGRDKSASLKQVNPPYSDIHFCIYRICRVLDCLLSVVSIKFNDQMLVVKTGTILRVLKANKFDWIQ